MLHEWQILRYYQDHLNSRQTQSLHSSEGIASEVVYVLCSEGVYVFTCSGHNKLPGQAKYTVVHVELNDNGHGSLIGRHYHL